MMPKSPSYLSLNSIKSKDTDTDSDNDDNRNFTSLYPYTRSEECSWQPDDVSNKLSDLLSIATESIPQSQKTANLLSHLHNLKRDNNGNGNGNNSSSSTRSSLQNCGWSTQQARYLRLLFGSNVVREEDDDDDNNDNNKKIREIKCIKKFLPWFYPITSAFTSQFSEPLNIMLLASGSISLLLGQTADAISIAVALTIVSLVAAVQEYRSEAALEKLNDLVPHTCTVMRDGRVRDGCMAKDLVVGDLVVLSSGE